MKRGSVRGANVCIGNVYMAWIVHGVERVGVARRKLATGHDVWHCCGTGCGTKEEEVEEVVVVVEEA
jgi:hypothetical protein